MVLYWLVFDDFAANIVIICTHTLRFIDQYFILFDHNGTHNKIPRKLFCKRYIRWTRRNARQHTGRCILLFAHNFITLSVHVNSYNIQINPYFIVHNNKCSVSPTGVLKYLGSCRVNCLFAYMWIFCVSVGGNIEFGCLPTINLHICICTRFYRECGWVLPLI